MVELKNQKEPATNNMETVGGTNQGQSSTQDNEVKKPFLTEFTVQNTEGTESSESPENEWGASSGKRAPQASPTGNDGINGTNSEENRSAKFKNPQVKQDEGAGAKQYE